MDDRDDETPPLPRERDAPPAAMKAGCIVACGLALLPVLYVGSFAFLVADDWFGWGLYQTLDERTTGVLEVVYAPLIWLYVAVMGIK